MRKIEVPTDLSMNDKVTLEQSQDFGNWKYIEKRESIQITDAAGVGKCYLATLLGNKACNQEIKSANSICRNCWGNSGW